MVSKNAVRAFPECLGGELAAGPDIHVATVVPQAIGTPIFEHAGNYTGRQVRPIPPPTERRRAPRHSMGLLHAGTGGLRFEHLWL